MGRQRAAGMEAGACQPFLSVPSFYLDKDQHPLSRIFLVGSIYLVQLLPPKSTLGFWTRRGREEAEKKGSVTITHTQSPGPLGIAPSSPHARLHRCTCSSLPLSLWQQSSAVPSLGGTGSFLSPADTTATGKDPRTATQNGSARQKSPHPHH